MPEYDPEEWHDALIEAYAENYGVDPDEVRALAGRESGGLRDRASATGPLTRHGRALGYLQVMPDTAKEMGYDPSQLHDPVVGIGAGVKYFALNRQKYGNFKDAATAYNAGPRRVGLPDPDLPRETRKYLYDTDPKNPGVIARLQQIKQAKKPVNVGTLKSPTQVQARQLGLNQPPPPEEQPQEQAATEDQPSAPSPDEPDTTTGSAGSPSQYHSNVEPVTVATGPPQPGDMPAVQALTDQDRADLQWKSYLAEAEAQKQKEEQPYQQVTGQQLQAAQDQSSPPQQELVPEREAPAALTPLQQQIEARRQAHKEAFAKMGLPGQLWENAVGGFKGAVGMGGENLRNVYNYVAPKSAQWEAGGLPQRWTKEAAEQAEIDPSFAGSTARAIGGIAPAGVAFLGSMATGVGELTALGVSVDEALVIGTTAATQDWGNNPKEAALNTLAALPFVKALGYTAKALAPVLDRLGPGFVNNLGKRAVSGGAQAVVGQLYTTGQNMVAQLLKNEPVNATAAFEGALPGGALAGTFGALGKIPTALKPGVEAETGLKKTPSYTGEDIPGERNASGGVVPPPAHRQGGIELGQPQPPPAGGPPGGAAGPFTLEGTIDPNGRPLVRKGGPQNPSPPGAQVNQTPSLAETTTQQTLDTYVAQNPGQQPVVDQLRSDLQKNPNDEFARRKLEIIKRRVQPVQGAAPQEQPMVPLAAQQLGEQGVPLGQPQPASAAAPVPEGQTPRQARIEYLKGQQQDLLSQAQKARTPKEVADIEARIKAIRAEAGPLGEQEFADQQTEVKRQQAIRDRLLSERKQAIAEAGLRQQVEPVVREIAAQTKAKMGLFPEQGDLATGFFKPDGGWQDFSRMSGEELDSLEERLRTQHEGLMTRADELPAGSPDIQPLRQNAAAIRDVLQRVGAWRDESADQLAKAQLPGAPEAEGAEAPEAAETPREQGRLPFPPTNLAEKYGHARLSWEAAPGTESGALPGYHTAPAREQLRFTKDINEATRPVMDDVYKALELDYRGNEISKGVWEGKVNPAGQDSIYFAHGDPTPEQIKSVEAGLAIKGKAFNQDAMAYHILSEAKGPEDVGAGVIDIGRGLNKLEMQKLDRLLTDRLGKDKYALIGNADGATILNFGEVPKFQSELSRLVHTDESRSWTKADTAEIGWAKAHSDYFRADQYDAKIKGVTDEGTGHLPKERAQSLESLSADLSSRVQGVYGKYARWNEAKPAEDISAGRVPPPTRPTGPGGGGTETVTREPPTGAGGVELTREEQVAAAKERPFDLHAQDALDEHRALQESKEEHGPHGHFYDNAFKGAENALYGDRAFQEALGVDPNEKSAMGATHAALRKALNVESLTPVHPGEVADFLQQHDLGPGTPTWDKFGRSYRNYKYKELVPAKAPKAGAPTEPMAPELALSAQLENSLIAQGKGTLVGSKYVPYSEMTNATLRRQLTTINRLYGEAVAKGNTEGQQYYDLHRQEVRKLVNWGRGAGVKPVVPEAAPTGKVEGPTPAPTTTPEAPIAAAAPIEAGPDILNRAIGHLTGMEETPVESLNPLEQRIRQFVSGNIQDTEGMNRALQGFAKGIDALSRYPESWMEGITPHHVWTEVEDAYNARVPQAEVAGERYREKGPGWNFREGADTTEGNRPADNTPSSPTRYVGPRGTTVDDLTSEAPGLQPRTEQGARIRALRTSPSALSSIINTKQTGYSRAIAERGQGAFNVAASESSAARLKATYKPNELQFARRVAEYDTTMSPDARRLTIKKIDRALKAHTEAVEAAREDLKAGHSPTNLANAHSTDVLQTLQQSKRGLTNQQRTTIEAALYQKGELPEPTPGLEMALLPGTDPNEPISPENFNRLMNASDLTDYEKILISHGPEIAERPKVDYPKDEPFSFERLWQLQDEANAKAGMGAHVFTGKGGETSVFMGKDVRDFPDVAFRGYKRLGVTETARVIDSIRKHNPDLAEVLEKGIAPDGTLRLTTNIKEFQKGRAGELPPEKPWQTERRQQEEQSGMRVTPARGDEPPGLYVSDQTATTMKWPEHRGGQLLDKDYVDKLIDWSTRNKPEWTDQLEAARGPDGTIKAYRSRLWTARSAFEQREAVRHESAHQLVNELDLRGPETLDWFKSHPLYTKISDKLRRSPSYEQNPQGMPEEALAFILGKQGGARPGAREYGAPPTLEYTKGGEPVRERNVLKMYLGLSHGEQLQYVTDLMDHVRDLRGPEAVQKMVDGIRSPEFRAEILDYAEKNYGIDTAAEREAQADLGGRSRAGSAGLQAGGEGVAERVAAGGEEAAPGGGGLSIPESGGERTVSLAGGGLAGAGGGGANAGAGPAGTGGAGGAGTGGPPPAGAGAPGATPSPTTAKGWGWVRGRTVINAMELMRPFSTLAHMSVFGKQIAGPLMSHFFEVAPKAWEGFRKGYSEKDYNSLLSMYSLGKYMEWGRKSGLSREGEASNSRFIKQISNTLEEAGVARKDIHDMMDLVAGSHNPDQMPFVSQLPVVEELKNLAASKGITKFHDKNFTEWYKNIGDVDEVARGPETMKGPLGWLAKTSKHSYIASKDAVRFTRWADMAELAEKDGHTPDNNPQLFKDLANIANSTTGRGEFTSKELNNLVNASSFLTWSTRYIKSRIDAFNPRRYISNEYGALGKFEPLAARINRHETARMFAVQAAMLGGLAVLSHELGDKAGISEVGINPNDDKVPFGTFKFKGRRWEIPGGYIPYVRWAAKEAMSAYHYETGTQTRDEENPLQVAWKFWRNKLSPAASLATDVATGTTFRGEQVRMKDWPKALAQRYVPFVIPDLWDDVNQYRDAPPEAKPGVGVTAIGTIARMLGEQNYPATGKPAKMADVHADTDLGIEQIRTKINTPHPTRRFDSETRESEPLEKFNIRRQREEEWWPKYGMELVKNPEWKNLTTIERRDALNALRYRVAREGSLEEPDEDKFDADTIIEAVKARELSKEETVHTKLWTPAEHSAGGRPGY